MSNILTDEQLREIETLIVDCRRTEAIWKDDDDARNIFVVPKLAHLGTCVDALLASHCALQARVAALETEYNAARASLELIERQTTHALGALQDTLANADLETMKAFVGLSLASVNIDARQALTGKNIWGALFAEVADHVNASQQPDGGEA